MSANSKIEWTDHTFNPWIGCTKVSPGCAHCYAEARDQRFAGGVHWGKGAPRKLTSEGNWRLPVRWNAAAAMYADAAEDDYANERGNGFTFSPPRPRVFCASLADWLDDEVPVAWLARLLALIHATPHLDWLLLTKRPENWSARMRAVQEVNKEAGSIKMIASWRHGVKPPANVWMGTTVEDQARAEERIPALLAIPARVRFLSCEPLLGPVDVSPWMHTPCRGCPDCGSRGCGGVQVEWVICGGESGPGARPMHPAWARGLRDQCAAAGVPFFMKQMIDGGKKLPFEQFPTDLQRREFP